MSFKRSIPLFKVFVSPDVVNPVGNVLMSGYIGQGEVVERFEALLREHFNNDYINTVNSATSGLHLALRMCDLSPGDEVLSSPLTCTATNWPILANNLAIKWVDTDPHTANLDLDDLARKITPKTKAVLVVHWGGYPIDLDKLDQILDRAKEMYGSRPLVIEDCAHAWGSYYRGKLVGNHGNYAVFSFQAIKHFTTVDGGLLITPNEQAHRRAKLLRWYGIDRSTNRKDFRCESDIPEWGYKFHMNDVNATV